MWLKVTFSGWVVPSRRFTLPCPSPLIAYKELKQSNPSPYMFYMQDELFTLFASPESALNTKLILTKWKFTPLRAHEKEAKA